MDVARSFSSDIAIRYVLPVLWMTSCFYTTGPMARHVYFVQRKESVVFETTASIKSILITEFCSTLKTKYLSLVANWGRSLLYCDFLVGLGELKPRVKGKGITYFDMTRPVSLL